MIVCSGHAPQHCTYYYLERLSGTNRRNVDFILFICAIFSLQTAPRLFVFLRMASIWCCRSLFDINRLYVCVNVQALHNNSSSVHFVYYTMSSYYLRCIWHLDRWDFFRFPTINIYNKSRIDRLKPEISGNNLILGPVCFCFFCVCILLVDRQWISMYSIQSHP